MPLGLFRLFFLIAILLLGTGSAPAQKTVRIPLADGFDYPVGKPDAKGYYKSRGFRPNGHLGDDWNGLGGGNTDLGDPVYSIGSGYVTFARDVRLGWGNVAIIRHAYRSKGKTYVVDSLYGHLQRVIVREGQIVAKGDQIGTIGTNKGMYLAHLHFEVRKNLRLGMDRSKFARDFSNYWNPTQFISLHRRLPESRGTTSIPINTYSTARTFGPPTDESKLRPSSSRKTTTKSSSSSKKLIIDVNRFEKLLNEIE